jgi:hypothetical protein
MIQAREKGKPMSRAIIHNSDYQSAEECMLAIDRYFEERNKPRRKTVDKVLLTEALVLVQRRIRKHKLDAFRKPLEQQPKAAFGQETVPLP